MVQSVRIAVRASMEGAIRLEMAKKWAEAINRHGGDATVVIPLNPATASLAALWLSNH